MFAFFDEQLALFNVMKIETIGDCYVCAVGLDERERERDRNFIDAILDMALRVQRRNAGGFSVRTAGVDCWLRFRIGIHCGAVTAGVSLSIYHLMVQVVGYQMPRYHLFGPVVGIANAMEQRGIAGRVNVSEDIVSMATPGRYDIESREETHVAENGNETRMWFVNGRKVSAFEGTRVSSMAD